MMRHTKNTQVRSSRSGVVLVEAIIAVGVLVTVFGGAIALYTKAIGGIRLSGDQLIATYLAEDAMDYIIAKREYNTSIGLITTADWLTDLTCIGSCVIDTTANIATASLVACGAACPLKFDSVTGRYNYDPTGSDTIFTRTVSVNSANNGGDEADIAVTVTWDDSSRTQQVALPFTLYRR